MFSIGYCLTCPRSCTFLSVFVLSSGLPRRYSRQGLAFAFPCLNCVSSLLVGSPRYSFFSRTRDCGTLFILKTSCKVFLLGSCSWTWDHAICPAPDHLWSFPWSFGVISRPMNYTFCGLGKFSEIPEFLFCAFLASRRGRHLSSGIPRRKGSRGKWLSLTPLGGCQGFSPLSTKGGQALIGIVINIIPFLISGMWVRSYTGLCWNPVGQNFSKNFQNVSIINRILNDFYEVNENYKILYTIFLYKAISF